MTETEYPTSSGGDMVGPTIYGHAGSAAAISVGAVRYTESATAPKEPEPYSSRGPVTHYFGPVVGSEAAPALATPEVLAKPDITATDCASTTFFARLEAGAWHFCGTSEAAPHAAAVAALMKQTSPLASPAAIAAAMESSATKFTPPSSVNSAEAVGAGLLNAAGALTALGGSPVDDPPSDIVPSLKEEAAAPPPTVELTRKPAALTNESRPTFEFKASRPVAFTCQIDGAAAQSCASPFVVPTALGDGTHGFVVTGVDAQGRSGTSAVYDFTVDTKAPKTSFVKKPKKLLKTRRTKRRRPVPAEGERVTGHLLLPGRQGTAADLRQELPPSLRQGRARGQGESERRGREPGEEVDRLPLPGQAASSGEGSGEASGASADASSVAPGPPDDLVGDQQQDEDADDRADHRRVGKADPF